MMYPAFSPPKEQNSNSNSNSNLNFGKNEDFSSNRERINALSESSDEKISTEFKDKLSDSFEIVVFPSDERNVDYSNSSTCALESESLDARTSSSNNSLECLNFALLSDQSVISHSQTELSLSSNGESNTCIETISFNEERRDNSRVNISIGLCVNATGSNFQESKEFSNQRAKSNKIIHLSRKFFKKFHTKTSQDYREIFPGLIKSGSEIAFFCLMIFLIVGAIFLLAFIVFPYFLNK